MKRIYYYHIITSTNLEEIKNYQTYPVVHFRDETCVDKCGRTGDGENRLEKIQGGENVKLCAGAEGFGTTERDGEFRVRWRNGRTRRYSIGTGSCERIGRNDKDVGEGVCGIGTYAHKGENSVSRIYDGPYKLIAAHQGTRRRHWHLVYISHNKQWGFNSRLGRTIQAGSYKNTSIGCVSCLREYLYSGNGRQILQDILGAKHISACICAEHSCGMDGLDSWKKAHYDAMCAEGGDSIFRNESVSFAQELTGLVDAAGKTGDGELHERRGDGNKISTEDGEILPKRQNLGHGNYSGENGNNNSGNANIILLLCANGAFTEGEAMEILTRTPTGIEFVCSKQYAERIKAYINVARILVFQETIKQRFERTKKMYETRMTELMTDEHLDHALTTLREILRANNINEEKFARLTFEHFTSKTGKKNNLFFQGPPTTGKTMIMTSLVECQFNFCRLTGLTPNSSFNFSGLLHTNACFMDECKLTENQFEQWKLLASGMPMSTDVKYKDRCDIKKCVLYTCSNYPIEMY